MLIQNLVRLGSSEGVWGWKTPDNVTRVYKDSVFQSLTSRPLSRTRVPGLVVWVAEDALSVEYGGEALSRYEVECAPAAGASSVGGLRRVKGHTLFETSFASPAKPLRLFDLDEVLGEDGWMKFLKLNE